MHEDAGQRLRLRRGDELVVNVAQRHEPGSSGRGVVSGAGGACLGNSRPRGRGGGGGRLLLGPGLRKLVRRNSHARQAPVDSGRTLDLHGLLQLPVVDALAEVKQRIADLQNALSRPVEQDLADAPAANVAQSRSRALGVRRGLSILRGSLDPDRCPLLRRQLRVARRAEGQGGCVREGRRVRDRRRCLGPAKRGTRCCRRRRGRGRRAPCARAMLRLQREARWKLHEEELRELAAAAAEEGVHADGGVRELLGGDARRHGEPAHSLADAGLVGWHRLAALAGRLSGRRGLLLPGFYEQLGAAGDLRIRVKPVEGQGHGAGCVTGNEHGRPAVLLLFLLLCLAVTVGCIPPIRPQIHHTICVLAGRPAGAGLGPCAEHRGGTPLCAGARPAGSEGDAAERESHAPPRRAPTAATATAAAGPAPAPAPASAAGLVVSGLPRGAVAAGSCG
mmetsp:Transcript_11746/g.45812  ORF Transcript_11746/g.45812 Transcript_11746/m.45812 type:complete len:449 (+) Transcript_11746:184-1530(+)